MHGNGHSEAGRFHQLYVARHGHGVDGISEILVYFRSDLLGHGGAYVVHGKHHAVYGEGGIEPLFYYFYGVHKYLHEVCENLKFTIAKIIKAENDYVDVSLIYKYYGEKEWKWLAGKSGVSGAVNLNEFINDPKTLYSYILSYKDETPLFCNDKSKSKIYKLGRRDNLFGGKGSFYAMPITFSNNQEALVEAILLISTYGVNFIALNSTKDEENEFRRILAYEVVPYYVSIIQSELGALYMRHNINRIRRFSLEDK